MLFLAALLSLGMGAALGLLGGGGSILTLPILVYALGIETRSAIATSLLVVGVTSLAALVRHARAGHVEWRTGLVFGGVSMVGAWGGGSVARYIPAEALLVGFAVLMAVTAVAMLRHGDRPDALAIPGQRKPLKLAVEGLVVGAVTGLVGAGGGFLVVPALTLMGGLPMRSAVGTSLLIIAMKSFAGFGGYLGHAEIDWQLAGLVGSVAVLGSFVGSHFACRLPAAQLRRGFGWFVLAMAAFMLVEHTGPALRAAVLGDRWPFWAGGAAIGAFVLLFLLGAGQPLGVSTGYADACAAPLDPAARRSWRLPFLAGIVGGGGVAALLAGGLVPSSLGSTVQAVQLTGGGMLLGLGARLAGGCTSGHSIVGMALLSPASIVASISFMAAGFAATWLLLP